MQTVYKHCQTMVAEPFQRRMLWSARCSPTSSDSSHAVRGSTGTVDVISHAPKAAHGEKVFWHGRLIAGRLRMTHSCCGCDREAIRKNATGLATTVGAEAIGASGLVPDPPPGSDDLLLHMLYTLTGATYPYPRKLLATRCDCADPL